MNVSVMSFILVDMLYVFWVKFFYSFIFWQLGMIDRMMEDMYVYGWKNGYYRGEK